MHEFFATKPRTKLHEVFSAIGAGLTTGVYQSTQSPTEFLFSHEFTNFFRKVRVQKVTRKYFLNLADNFYCPLLPWGKGWGWGYNSHEFTNYFFVTKTKSQRNTKFFFEFLLFQPRIHELFFLQRL